MMNKKLYVEKTNIFNIHIDEEMIEKLRDGEVLLKINKYALTSNNVTYAVTGFQIKYWDFFPAPNPWGLVPVWGFAEVLESKADGIEKGEKIYGYFPMAEYLKILPGRINAHSFTDISEHRSSLAPIYNNYMRFGMSLDFPKGTEDFLPIVRPLFTTSFLINEFLKNEDFFKADQIIITSASSKTSLGLAFVLHQHKNTHKKTIIGLTSKTNVEFVKKTGLYDQVIDYKDVKVKLAIKESVAVDMSGNSKFSNGLYEMLKDKLVHLCKVGLTDWTAASMDTKIPVARFFFAPTYAQDYYKKKGPQEANDIINKALFAFIEKAEKWIDIEYIKDFEKLQSTFSAMIKGDVDPSKGYIIKNS